MIRKFQVQIINCQGSLGMQNFDFFNVMNSFGARNIIRNIRSTDCVCCYVRYESIITDNSLVFSSTFQVPQNQLVVPVEIVSNQLFITSIDSLRFKTLILNSKVYDIVNAFEDFDDLHINIDDLCHVISGLRKSYYQRVLKYTMRGFVDKDNCVMNSLGCLLHKLYDRLRVYMELHETVLVNGIHIADVLMFINEVIHEIPQFLQSFDMVLLSMQNVPLSIGCDVIL
jgi:hypothetical protein